MKELTWLEWQIEGAVSGDVQELQNAWRQYLSRDSWVIEKKSKKAKSGVTTLDVIPLVKEISFTDGRPKQFVMKAILSAQNPGLNPTVMVNALTEETPQFAVEEVRCRRMAVLDNEGKTFR